MPTAFVVEDDLATCELLQACLEQVGYTTIIAQNGQRALETLQQQSFDLITLDLAMPKVNGAAVLRGLRSDVRHEHATVVVITGTPHMIDTQVANLADFVMNKPLDMRAFANFAQRLRETD